MSRSPSPMTVKVFAPAKINLTLHVTGQRADGYHLLDSLVVFAPVGDQITIRDGNALTVTVDGPEAADVPADMDNIALKAAMLAAQGQGATLTLHKALPVASGIGGGSADAAAAFRGMRMFKGQGEAGPGAARTLLGLGADVPMCLMSRPVRARGVGDRLDELALPEVPAVLVNPRVGVSTPSVFRALTQRTNPGMPDPLPDFADAPALIDFVAGCRNDLEPAARAVAPVIDRVLSAIGQTAGCRLARMSGSGATCFGLFESIEEAQAAQAVLVAEYPDWWVAGGLLGDQSQRAMPQVS